MDGHRKLERKAKLGLGDYCHASTRQINHEPVQGSLFFVFDTSRVKHSYQIHTSLGVA